MTRIVAASVEVSAASRPVCAAASLSSSFDNFTSSSSAPILCAPAGALSARSIAVRTAVARAAAMPNYRGADECRRELEALVREAGSAGK